MQIFVSNRKRASIQRPSRCCGGASWRPSGKKSAARLARISNALANPFPFSRNTISSPRRKISTSLLFSRNSFGNRTAWLLPERKTRAVAIWVHSFNIYADVYTSRKGSNASSFGAAQLRWAGRRPGRLAPCHVQSRWPLRTAMCIVVFVYTLGSGTPRMRTNIEIDDTLMAEAQKVSGHATKKQTVEQALRLMIRLRQQQDVDLAFGKYRWRGNL